ncbi:MAG: urea ABC transporter permease subunit UrtB [Rhizobiaceae bacterium]|jgi:urea transport system permease protein|nr:urea ABC transporter permease subunit UrtB [Rhizobiaceae bacterium]
MPRFALVLTAIMLAIAIAPRAMPGPHSALAQTADGTMAVVTEPAAPAPSAPGPLQAVLQANADAIAKPSRTTVDTVIAALLESNAPGAATFLAQWRDRGVVQRKADGLFFYGVETADGFSLTDPDTGKNTGNAAKADVTQLRPNSGVRGVLSSALVQFQLADPDIAVRESALIAIERGAEASQLEPLRASIEAESDAGLKARKTRLERLLTIQFDPSAEARIAAIESFAGDISVDVRAALNPLVATTPKAFAEVPAGTNVARALAPGGDIPLDDAYGLLVTAGLAQAAPTLAEMRAALIANRADGAVAGVPVAALGSQAARMDAYARLAAAGTVPPPVTEDAKRAALATVSIVAVYNEPDANVTAAAEATLASISRSLALNQTLDLALDALSLASIYFLAAIGLAITFGVMRVINMAHGEFIMIGAYTGYVVQQFITDYTLSILVALPLAFFIAALAGVAMERLVIRHLARRPLETLLATFGISIALQQIAKNIFGTQARPLTAPAWLDGAWVVNDVVSISTIRIAIFVLALIFLALLLFILARTRLGLEVRAVTQNPAMASSMGINPDRINMLTFGLGSGIAGIAGVAIGLFAKVTSDLGSGYIVQSFMTVVVGGVGNIWGTLAGASMIGSLQKVIEFFNPSNTLAAQTYMIIFIIIFIQFRPKGIIALKGRAAGD